MRARTPRSAPALVLLLGATLWGCQRADHPSLSYDGSTLIARDILPDLVAGYEATTGDRFGAVSTHGSSEGFQAVMEGRVALGGVSRPLKSRERVEEPYYAIIGYDGIAIFVNAANPLQAMTRAQLKDVFTGKTTNWKALGGPDAPIELVYMLTDLDPGSVDIFRAEVLEGQQFGPGFRCGHGEQCVAAVASRPNAVTFTSVSHLMPGVKLLTLDGQAPEPATVRSGEYLLSRPLLLLTKSAPRGAAKAFLDYVLSPEGQARVARRFVSFREGL